MPRKRHDSSDEDSDSSLSDRNTKGKSKKSSKGKDKKQKASKSSKKRNASESSSDAPPLKQRSTVERRKGQMRRESESDSSPVKKSVQSRIQKPGNHGRDRRTSSRENQVNKRAPLASDPGSERRKKRVPAGSPQGSRERPGLRSRSPELPARAVDRFPLRGDRISPYEDRADFRGRPMDFDRRDRDDFERELPPTVDYGDRLAPFDSRDRGEFLDRHLDSRERFEPRGRDMMRDPISPDRGFTARRNDRLSPDWRGGREAPGAMLYNRRSVSLERDQRFHRRQSISPIRKNDRHRPISPRRMDSLPVIDRHERAISPERFDRRQRDHRSFSPEKQRQRGRRSISPEKPRIRNSDAIVDISPVRKHRLENSFENDKSPEQKGKSGKGSKKKKGSKNNNDGQVSSRNGKERRKERSESLERSFERSKQSLVIPSEREFLKESKVQPKKNGDAGREPNKSNKKKRPRSTSGSPQRVKKTKENDKDNSASTEKKGKKKGKKEKHSKSTNRSRSRSKSADSLVLASMKKGKNKNSSKTSKASHSKKSLSRSPSPIPKSSRSDLNRSRSSDVSVGRKHDMAQFESEPESGEITDSEDESKGLKSQVKKPILTEAEEKEQQEADAKYWNEKRKESKRREEESSQSSSRNNRESNKREHSAKRNRTNDESKSAEPKGEPESAPPAKKPKGEGTQMLTGRTGGAYIPPARLRAMQASITDKTSVEYQRISWEALKKSINGLVNKVNVSNIENIVRELFQENIVRGRGLFARAIIQAQSASPTFTHVYAALVAIVNTKFPQNGELVLRRLIMQFRRGYKRNDKTICLSATRFVAHLVNQQVAHEVLALEILTLLIEEPTDDSVEVAIGFLKECGQKLTDVSPRGINAIFERLRNVLHESQIDKRVQYMVEVMFAVRKDGFKDYPSLEADLDLVEEEDQFTHLLTLEDAGNTEELLNVFRPDPEFQENEEKYKILKKEILGEDSSDEEDGSGDDDDDDDSSEDEDEEESEEKKQTVIDNTETNMVALRRTIYLTIQSSLDFEECAHKLMKMDLKPGQEVELCNMILDCCAQMRTYEKFFGLLAGRFCVIDKKYVAPFQTMFQEQYETIHRLETNKLRNVGKFFSHLLFTDSISWAVLSCIKLNEEDTTSASRIFIKILFQELSEYMGLPKLNERLKDPTLMEYFVGLMPRDNPRDTRFAINFFTTIGLGGLTDDLREHLKDVSKKLMQQKQEEQLKAAAEDSSDSSDSDSDSSSDSDNSSDSDSSSESESSEDEKRKKNKKKPVEKHNDKERRKEKVVPQKEKERGRDKGKGREKEKGSEKEIAREKLRGREKEKGKGRDRGDNQLRDRKADKKAKKKQPSEAEQQKEREKQFKRLARLANYDEEIIDGVARSKRSLEREERSDRKGKENGDRRERRRKADEREFEREPRPVEVDVREHDFEDDQLIRGRQRARERDLYTDRPLDRGCDTGVYERDDRLETVDRRRSGKRSKDFIDADRHDPSIRVERNFERMDIYEDKFEQDRVRNLEYVRARPEFEDYYEGRDGSRGRGAEREGRRRRDLPREVSPPLEDAGFDARQYRDRAVSSDRRRNRSEERIPLAREPRRRRR